MSAGLTRASISADPEVAAQAKKAMDEIAELAQRYKADAGPQAMVVAVAQKLVGLVAVHGRTEREIARLSDEIEKLKAAQTATLADSYKGIWQPGEYERGQVVTFGGSLWLALERCMGKPGESHKWRLIVKGAR